MYCPFCNHKYFLDYEDSGWVDGEEEENDPEEDEEEIAGEENGEVISEDSINGSPDPCKHVAFQYSWGDDQSDLEVLEKHKKNFDKMLDALYPPEDHIADDEGDADEEYGFRLESFADDFYFALKKRYELDEQGNSPLKAFQNRLEKVLPNTDVILDGMSVEKNMGPTGGGFLHMAVFFKFKRRKRNTKND